MRRHDFMESNLPVIKALTIKLLAEIDCLNGEQRILECDRPFDFYEKVREFETKLIQAALFKAGGNQRRAAQLLKLKSNTLNNKIKLYNIKILKETAESVND